MTSVADHRRRDAAQEARHFVVEPEGGPQHRVIGHGAEGEEADPGGEGQHRGDDADLDQRELLVEQARLAREGGAAEQNHGEAADARQGEPQIGAAQHREEDGERRAAPRRSSRRWRGRG